MQHRSRATVAAITEAAAHILAEKGLDAVTTNAVAQRAGVGIGSLYQYYPNREAILADLLRDKLATLVDRVERATNEPTFDAALHAMLRALARSYVERPALAAALLYVETLIEADEEIARLRARLGRAIVGFLRTQDVRDPELAARDVTALACGMALAAGLNGERDVEALAERMGRAVRGYVVG